MSGLVFACIAPHGSMIVPVLAGEDGQKALATRAAMEELGQRMAASAPETLVLVTPHGHRVDGVFSLLNNQHVRGELGLEKDSESLEDLLPRYLSQASGMMVTGAEVFLNLSPMQQMCPRLLELSMMRPD